MTSPKARRRSEWLPRILIMLTVGAVIGIVIVERMKKPPPDRAQPIEARLELAAGEVRVEHGGETRRALSQTPLLAGSRVETTEAARALVRLPDGAAAFLRGDTTITLAGEAVELGAGEYFLDAPPLEREPLVHRIGEVSVSAVDAGLSIKKTDRGAEIYVARGMAVVSGPAGRAEAHAGELAVVESGAPNVQPLSFWEDWTGGMADYGGTVESVAAGNGEIYAVDSGGTAGRPADRLQIKSQSVRAVIRSGLAETEVDQTFFNPSQREVEGWYWFSVPEGASVTGFAVETDGQLVEGELIERREAAAKYTGAKASGHAPAILEWIDPRTYRARIYPIQSSGTRRVVLRYIELLEGSGQTLSYVYPMAGRSPMRIGELSISVDLGDAGTTMEIATLAEAKVDRGGRLVTMRRSGYTPRVDFQLEARLPEARPGVTVARYHTGGESADYLMARYTPDLPWEEASKQTADVVVVVDTSAAGDEASRLLKVGVAEAILRALSPGDRFGLIALDARPRALYPNKGLADAKDAEIAKALEALAGHEAGGATDLSAMFEVALERVHDALQPAVVYVGDGIATSGALSGEQLVERLRRALATSRARLFTVAVGPESDEALLGELARAGGGASMHVQDARNATSRALELTAAMKVPTLTDFELDLGAGLDEPFLSVSGKVSRGQEVVLLARTHHDLPERALVRGRLAGKTIEREVPIAKDDSVIAAFVPRLWAAEYVRRLLGAAAGPEAERGRIAELGIDYGLMTPFTSILALESEAAYSNMGIERRRLPLRGVRLGALDRKGERNLAAMLHAQPPATAFGCFALGRSADEEQAPAPPPPMSEADDKEGGMGTRATGDEGSMGNPRYGVAGPADIPADPQAARRQAQDDAQQFGMIGLLPSRASGNLWARDTGGQTAPSPPAVPTLGTCSAEARRPLAQRARVWTQRLRTAGDPSELLARYSAAMRACELTDWRAERMFLELMQQRIDSEAAARAVLAAFAARPEVQRHVAKLILRRVVDDRIVAAVEAAIFGAAIDWAALDRELSAIEDVGERMARLRQELAKAPDDPNGIIRLVALTAEASHTDEALALGRRLREQGLLTLKVVRQLGDVLARQKLDEEAVRTYSEIVEFDPHNVGSRWLLGDIYLGRGWYEPAYRQYKTAVELAPDDALGWLRLAAAAAGAGRVDEALRIERRVAGAQGRPGPDDPRRWARLLSAGRLARLLAAPPKGAAPAAFERELKELGLFRGEGTLVLLTWQDLTSDVALVTREGDRAVAAGDAIDAAPVGAFASLLSSAELSRLSLTAQLRSLPRAEPLALTRHDVRWDGKRFVVEVRSVDLPAGETRVAL